MRMSRSKKFAAVVAVAALGFGVAACGDDDDNGSSDTTAVEDATDDTDVAEDGTIVDLAVANPDFSYLVSLLQTAGLVETLSGEGPFTVLAPTDDAFLALAQELIGPEATLDDLTATVTEDPAILESILLTHVISGNVLAADTVALDGAEAETLSGEMLTVASDGTAVSFTTGASTVNVTAADVIGTNGVIHVIDAVIVPLAQQS